MGADSTTSETHTLANIKGRKSLLSHLRFLRNLPGCEETKVIDMQTETATRESFRIDGHYQITHEDYVTGRRSEEHTSELQSLMRISYAVFCLKKKNNKTDQISITKFKYKKNIKSKTK